MYARLGKVVFVKDIRGFLGPTTLINDSMMATVETDPEYFWYYNNGITIVCFDCVEITHWRKNNTNAFTTSGD